jgi:hypothetical protein
VQCSSYNGGNRTTGDDQRFERPPVPPNLGPQVTRSPRTQLAQFSGPTESLLCRYSPDNFAGIPLARFRSSDILSAVPASIHALAPLESGGTIARRGFAVQDHVAAGLCLDMLADPTLAQVWCESQDDITLVWLAGIAEEIEFVQVKSNELDQLWTIAKLMEKEKKQHADGTKTDGLCILVIGRLKGYHSWALQ